ncbi:MULTISPECIES: DNA (cytosine-5-)-methyltransferase [unclassified Caballeronia]|uniref:DNA (cytosine-5-)-methyltransferase n=1 Tax=unclassified Caballeronia TaxID=2646786 RepID=UPI00202844A3|nr:DNA (cytosine-5-)-methyltransferase [Caballeronia sp. LZ028]MDR5768109.1 DNA (cytosine-5-)-methyltransferase [Caballeronia sp. LZ028]
MSNQQNYDSPEYACRLNVIELFAGVGGFRLGLEQVHGQPFAVSLSNQFEPGQKAQHASDVYVARWGERNHINQDIFSVLASSDGQRMVREAAPDVLAAGFPCQDYSVAKPLSLSKGLAGKKGILWWAIAQLLIQRINDGQPIRYLILENVDRLIASPATSKGADFATVLSTLRGLGYAAEWRVVNAADYGLPQKRRRVFIVAYHSSTGAFHAMQRHLAIDGLSWHREGILQSAFPSKLVLPLDGATPALAVMDEPLATQMAYRPLSNGKSRFANSGFMLEGNVWTAKTRVIDIEDYQPYTGKSTPMTLGDVVRRTVGVPESFYISNESEERFRAAKGAKRVPRNKNGFSYEFTEGAMSFPDRLDAPSRTIITSEGGAAASRTKHVVATTAGRLRRLVPEELEELNGFPRGFTEHPNVSDTKRAFLMGNALVVGLVTRIGEALFKRHMSGAEYD